MTTDDNLKAIENDPDNVPFILREELMSDAEFARMYGKPSKRLTQEDIYDLPF